MKRKTKKSPGRVPLMRIHLEDDEMVVDNFAGGGGASSGIEWAINRSPDIAINHDAEAIDLHRANHPETKHYVEDIWDVDPKQAVGKRRVGLVWCSPDCKHFSHAKGSVPLDAKIRGLAWAAVRWAEDVRPRVIALENVPEFVSWGPLGRDGMPIKARAGETFREFVGKLEALGYVVEHRLLRACDYGAPTTRRRLFLIARCDGHPIVWPEPTHGPDRAEPFRTAADCIDWSVAAPSIFERSKPHAEKTLARIARGVRKFVVGAARPFIVPTNHGGRGRNDRRVHSVDEPMRTVTSHGRGSHAVVTPFVVTARGTSDSHVNSAAGSIDEPLRTISASGTHHRVVVPYLVHRSNGERPAKKKPDGSIAAAQAPRIYDVKEPLGTVMAQGQKHALVNAFLVKHNGGNNDRCGASGQELSKPVDSITSRDSKSLATVSLALASDPEAQRRARAVYAFLVRYNGKGEPEELTKPLGTLTTHDRYGLVTVEVDGETYVIVDIGMRMLTPRELFLAQGFSEDYDITAEGVRGEPLTKTAQVRCVGNSVAPPVAAAIVRAQFGAAIAVPRSIVERVAKAPARRPQQTLPIAPVAPARRPTPVAPITPIATSVKAKPARVKIAGPGVGDRVSFFDDTGKRRVGEVVRVARRNLVIAIGRSEWDVDPSSVDIVVASRMAAADRRAA